MPASTQWHCEEINELELQASLPAAILIVTRMAGTEARPPHFSNGL